MAHALKHVFLWVFLSSTGLFLPKASAQTYRYFVLLTDKDNSPYTLDNPHEYLSDRSIQRRIRQGIDLTINDLPVNPTYLQLLKNTGATVLKSSRWLNGVAIEANESQINVIKSLPFVKGLERNGALNRSQMSNSRVTYHNKWEATTIDEELNYGSSRTQLEMLGITGLHASGKFGTGIYIGVIDSGFRSAHQQDYLSHLYTNNKIVDTYDFIANETDVTNDHTHGLNVLSVIAALKDNLLIGAAPHAHYALYRSEDVFAETPFEEIAWLLAAERADSVGVDIINTSLGYYSFDNPEYDYKYSDMDGQTALISRAARMASRTGMLMVTSAGNEGNNSWKYITAPADVDSVLTVGAIDINNIKVGFSSIGPAANGVIKPDVVALGSPVSIGNTNNVITFSQGTSFSAPLMAGFAALLWEANPQMTAQQLAQFIRSSGDQAANPDVSKGYGLPYFNVLDINYPFNFEGILQDNKVSLTWDFGYTFDSQYELQRAFNEGSFETIAITTNRSFEADTLTQAGKYQYRVRSFTDYSKSKFTYSDAFHYYITGTEPTTTSWNIGPIPAHQSLTLSTSGYGNPIHLTVLQINGHTIANYELDASQTRHTISIEQLPVGLYLLRIMDQSGTVSYQKFIKQ